MSITNQQAIQYAQNCINDLQEEILDSFGSFYTLDSGGLIRVASEREDNFMVRLGNIIYEWTKHGLTQRRQREAMERVASDMEDTLGKPPYADQAVLVPTIQMISNGLQAEMTSFDLGLFPDLGLEIIKDVSGATVDVVEKSVDIVGSVGKGLGDIAVGSVEATKSIVSDLPKYLPWIIGALVLMAGVFVIGYLKKVIPK